MLKTRIAAALPRPGSLGHRMLQAGSWSLASTMTLHMIRLASNLIMTRFLVPEAFGLMALVGTIIAAFSLFTDIGINRSVMREPDGDTDRFLRAAWMVKVARGAAVAAGVVFTAFLLWLLAPGLAPSDTVYADPRLPGLIALSALAPLLMGAESTAKELMQRRLQLGRITAVEIGAQALSTLSMIAFALVWPTVWALLAGMLTANVLKAAASHTMFIGPRMVATWNREIADRLWHYGKWLIGSSTFTFIASNADKFILGSLMNATTFGVYVIAQVWISAGLLLIGQLSDQIGFATISEVIRDRPSELPRLYSRFQKIIGALCIVSFVATFIFGELLINILYPADYAEAGTYIAILSFQLLTVRFEIPNLLIMNMGNTRAMMTISAVRAVSICALLPLAYSIWGIFGVLVAVALNPLITLPYTLYLIRPHLGNREVQRAVVWVAAIVILLGLVVTFYYT